MTGRVWILAMGFLAVLLGACATTREAQFYTLDAVASAVNDNSSALSLALGPIDLPRYLDRPQIVARGEGNRLVVDEFNRWGGSLDEEIQRVLTARLGNLLGTQRIYSYPSRIVAGTDYRIALDVRAFDGTRGGEVRLDVAWSLINDRTADVAMVRRAVYTAVAVDPTYSAYADALSDLLMQLSGDLAVALRVSRPASN